MKQRYKKSIFAHYRLNKLYFNKIIFFAMSLFYFAALVNIRDFPLNNLPLIYPIFLICFFMIGLKKMILGFKNTLFLCSLITIYFVYFNIISLQTGGGFSIRKFANLLEPLMIFITTGAVTTKQEDTDTALLALISVIIFSTLCGLWIYFIGEPVASWRLAMQSSVGGTLFSGEMMSIAGPFEVVNNAGLSYYAFSFSYQLAIAATIIICALLSSNNILLINKKLMLLFLSILIFGLITNAERATLLSICMGLTLLTLINKNNLLTLRNIVIFLTVFLIIWVAIFYTQNTQYTTLHQRQTSIEELSLRLVILPIGALETVLTQPFGAGGISDSYIQIAYDYGWLVENEVISPHNHFSNIIMYTGVIGIILVLSLVIGLLKKIRFAYSCRNSLEIILVSACIASIGHSLTHNAGFFKGDQATQIVFGLLWGHHTILSQQIRQSIYPIKENLRVK